MEDFCTKLHRADDGQNQGADFLLSLLLKQNGLSEAFIKKNMSGVTPPPNVVVVVVIWGGCTP